MTSAARRASTRAATAAVTTRARGRRGWPAAASKAAGSIGKTDAKGETVVDGMVKPEDFYASIAHATGMDGAKTFYTNQGRPIQIVYKDGRVVRDLFG